MSTHLNLLDRVRSTRRQLAEVGPNDVRSEGDFERVSLPSSDGDVLRDLIVAEDGQAVIELRSARYVPPSRQRRREGSRYRLPWTLVVLEPGELVD